MRLTRRPVAESVEPAVHQGARSEIVEASTATPTRPGRLLVQLIKAGWSANGRYYPAAVLRRDGAKAFPKGTLNFVDHPTAEEDEERPAGSMRNLASYQTEDARWDASRNALVAEVRLYAPWREAVTDWADSGAVGMSIRAWVYGEEGEADGRRGWIVSEFESGRSVDYVTMPAAGGALLKVLESVGSGHAQSLTEARNVGVWLESRLHLALTQLGDDMYGNGRLTRDERITLSSAIGDALKAWTARVEADAPQLFKRDLWDEPENGEKATAEATAVEATSDEMRRALTAAVRAAHGGEGTYIWVRDYDADANTVWWDQSTQDACETWQQTYTVAANGTVALGGDPVQVVARIVYDPVPAGGDTVVQQTESVSVVEHTTPVPTPLNVTDGAPPTAPTHPPTKETSVSGNQNTGPAPGAGGAAEGQATAVSPDVAAANARATLAEAQRDEALARAAAVTEAQNAAARANAERDAAVAESRRLRADNAGRDAVTKALAESGMPDNVLALITPRVTDRIVGRVPTVAESGDVDTTSLTAAIAAAIEAEKAYAAALLEAQGVGTVRGLGATTAGEDISDADFEAGLSQIFAGTGMNDDIAKRAAKGRM